MNNTLSNGFRVLEYLAASGGSHSVKELADHFQLPNSHICRLLKTLLDTGFIRQNQDRRYAVSVRIVALSNACLSQLDVRNAAHRHLYQLHREIGLRVYLAVPDRGRALIVDVVSSGEGDELDLNIGRFNAPNYSACGKLCAAWAAPEDQEAVLRQALDAPTPRALSDRAALLTAFAAIREQRYSIADGESAEGVYAVAAPIFYGDGTLAAAVGSYFNAPALHGVDKKGLLERVIRTANAVSCELLANSSLPGSESK